MTRGPANGARHCLAATPDRTEPAPTRATLPRSGISITWATLVPGTGHQRRPPSGSRVSAGRRAGGHVASGELPRGPRAACSGPPPGHGLGGRSPAISGARRQKRPLTPRRGPFAVRHRLRTRSPASPRGPLVVSSSRSPDFPEIPGPGHRPGPAGRPDGSSPRRPGLSGPHGPGPPGGDSHPFVQHGPDSNDRAGCFPVAHPRPHEIGHRIEHRDWTRATRGTTSRLAPRDYSAEPPSSRASSSPGTRLYGYRHRGGW